MHLSLVMRSKCSNASIPSMDLDDLNDEVHRWKGSGKLMHCFDNINTIIVTSSIVVFGCLFLKFVLFLCGY